MNKKKNHQMRAKKKKKSPSLQLGLDPKHLPTTKTMKRKKVNVLNSKKLDKRPTPRKKKQLRSSKLETT